MTGINGAGFAAHIHSPSGAEADLRPRRLMVRTGLAGAVAAALLCAACSSDSKGSSAEAATTPTTTAAAPATTVAAPTTTAAPVASASPEAERVAAVRPTIDVLTAALASGDLEASQAALEAYDAAWNGIEVYVNIRSLSMYLKLEADLQGDLEDGLTGDAPPDFAALKAKSEELGARFDEAVEMSKNGMPLNPLVDDVTTLRIIRADLRLATSALADGKTDVAKDHYAKFKENFDSTAEPMLGLRNSDNEKATEDAVDAAAAAFANASTSADDLSKALAKVTSTYNFGVSLWNAAARAADDGKTSVTTTDLLHLGQLHDVKIQLVKSMKAWTDGDYERAGSVADAAENTVFTRVQAALAARGGADLALKKLLDAYLAVAAAAGDAKDVGAANQAAINGVTVAEQALLGQFWTDEKVQAYVDSLPEVDPLA